MVIEGRGVEARSAAWPGLRRQVRLRPLLEKCPCFPRPLDRRLYRRDPIRLHVEIAVAGPGIYVDELPSLFHVEAHRLEGRIEHAGVGGEQQPAGVVF
jgi:hypothetical protein